MPRPQRPWFRFYVEAVHDRKLRRRTPAQRWLWVAILAAARESPVPGHLLISEREPMDETDLADYAGMTVREVRTALPLFAETGLIERDEHLGCWWVPKFHERQFESDDVTKRTAKHRSLERDRNVPTSFPGTPQSVKTETETETDPQTPTPDDFQAFWSTYPRREDRKTTEARWRRLSHADREAALAALPRHVEHWRREHPRTVKFVPHASTWLNGRRWEDELTSTNGTHAAVDAATGVTYLPGADV